MDNNTVRCLEQSLPPPPLSAAQAVGPSYEWMQQMGLFTEWHINSLVLTFMGRSKYVRNVELEVNLQAKYIKCKLVVGLLTLYLDCRKNTLIKLAKEAFNIYAPQFNVDLEFGYGRSGQ